MTKDQVKESLRKVKEDWKHNHNFTSNDSKNHSHRDWIERNRKSDSSERTKPKSVSAQ